MDVTPWDETVFENVFTQTWTIDGGIRVRFCNAGDEDEVDVGAGFSYMTVPLA